MSKPTNTATDYWKAWADVHEQFVKMHEREAVALFEKLKSILGSKKAKQIFTNVAKSARRRTGPRGPRNPAHDRVLLNLYDRMTGRRSIQRLAKSLDERCPGLYGNSAAAIDKKLRRLLRKRDQKVDRLSVWPNLWMSAPAYTETAQRL